MRETDSRLRGAADAILATAIVLLVWRSRAEVGVSKDRGDPHCKDQRPPHWKPWTVPAVVLPFLLFLGWIQLQLRGEIAKLEQTTLFPLVFVAVTVAVFVGAVIWAIRARQYRAADHWTNLAAAVIATGLLGLAFALVEQSANVEARQIALIQAVQSTDNLTEVDLEGSDLSNLVLSARTDLTRANLRDADLAGASLFGVIATQADLVGIDLSGANLTEGKFSGAIMEGAILENAFLERANLFEVLGIPASTAGVIWDNTTCPDGTNSDTNVSFTCDAHFLALPGE